MSDNEQITQLGNPKSIDLHLMLAERDAEIAALKRRVNEADQIVAAGEAERKALAAQVAELQAWKDAVPVLAIDALHYEASGSVITQSQDDDIRLWLFEALKQ